MRNRRLPSQEVSSNEAAAPVVPARTAQPPDGRREAATSGTQSTNRVPNTSIDSYFIPLRWGVDSLYFSFPGRLLPDIKDQLAELKRLAQSDESHEQALAQYPIGAHIFEVSERAVKGYAYILEDGAFRITLTRGGYSGSS